jgi:hypothetical protein
MASRRPSGFSDIDKGSPSLAQLESMSDGDLVDLLDQTLCVGPLPDSLQIAVRFSGVI